MRYGSLRFDSREVYHFTTGTYHDEGEVRAGDFRKLPKNFVRSLDDFANRSERGLEHFQSEGKFNHLR